MPGLLLRRGVVRSACHRPLRPVQRCAPLFTLSLVLSLACSTGEETYPSRPIRLICPWAVGGGTDRISRHVATFLEKELAVPVNVINAPGGAGVTGHSRGARARPDGYTLTMMTVEIDMLHWLGLTQISWQDFEPVMLINRDPAAVFVRTDDARHETLAALLREARDHPGALTASGTALGGIWHLALAGALSTAGLDPGSIRWVPMNGAAPALQELVSGGLDLVASSLPEAETFLTAGRVRSLGVMANERVPAYPAIPTFKDQGIDWTMASWRGLAMPAGTPEAIRDRVLEAMTRIVSGQTVVNGRRFPELMENEGFTLRHEPPAAFQATLSRTDAELGRLLTSKALASLQTERFDAMHFPRLLFVLLGVTLIALLVSSIHARRRAGAGAGAGAGAATATRLRAPSKEMVHFLEVVLAVALYALFAEKLGFILTAGVILFALLWRLGNRLAVCTLVTALLVPAVYGLFATALRVPLPRGLLGW